MRTFLAIDISDEVRKKVAFLIEKFKGIDSGIKWVDPNNIHITIYFFGEIDENTKEGLETIVETSLKGVSRFSLTVEEISAFPSMRYPRVIWVGIKDESGELGAIFSTVKDGIEERNLPVNRENRAYKPHLTLGRVKRHPGNRLMREIEKHGTELFGSFTVDSVTLYRSTLTRDGPMYESLRKFSI
ncbi:MAG: RNA 2',3'-cyclic phosphodiesterase [Spirochaetota bacterium]|nr:MAG: RNA 2',3'-cyclic phosphodiesterase [Spirochaetota bacterium]